LGTLPLLEGERRENELLRLGFFTQDLAQELDPDQRAVDIVTEYARGGQHGDVFISDQDARGALGRLGLTGEKAMRRIRDLSGGEKARVALAMFSLKPSNLYLLDEVSNHLDTECAEALSQALSKWGGDRGAVVVVSHDRDFCSKIEFTHIATVSNGKLVMEARSARESDWVIDSLATQPGDHATSTVETITTSTETQQLQDEMDAKLRKKAFNAPKRITKLEELVEDAEMEVAALDEEMLSYGTDVGRLMEMTNKKERIQAKIAEYMDEWEELEEVLSQFEAVATR
jgi:ATP-binding cassette, subfamily F, member 3